jgi:UDP-N-acetylmuramoyl-tripeptide--D-alanyl-D-alanine ligase
MINLKELIEKKLINQNSLPSLAPKDLLEKLILTIDTRKVGDANSFLAMKGEKFNSFEFIKNLVGTSIHFIFYEDNQQNKLLLKNYQEDPALKNQFYFIPILSDLIFLQKFAYYYGQAWRHLSPHHYAIGISGSNGKTSNKDILSFLLSDLLPGKVISTLKNDNNHIGVPLTILRLREDSQILICELGSNHPGEMKVLLDILRPDIGLTTNIGQTHLEFFSTLNDVFLEEGLLYHYIAESTEAKRRFYLNDHDSYLNKLKIETWVLPFSKFNLHATDHSISLKWSGKDLIIQNQWIWGKHNFLNLGVCLVMAFELAEKLNVFSKETESLLIKSASQFKFQNLRSEWRDIEGKKYFVDAYNANPSSMKVALSSFVNFINLNHYQSSEAVIVIGDMRELGDHTQSCHEDLGSYLNDLTQSGHDIKMVYVGEFGNFVSSKYKGELKIFPNVLDCSKDWNKIITDKKLVFLKASRAIKLENLINLS